MRDFGFGILGTGMIAKAIADAVEAAGNARLAAVSSRNLAKAEAFVAARPGTDAVEGLADLLARQDVDAVYVAIPTTAKEEAALAAVAAGKHVLVDKPFVDASSVARMARASAESGLLFMDATHFVHHPRRDALRSAIEERIGRPRSLHGHFYTSLKDRQNIRFDPTAEPTGALGDLGWYSVRAVVEYLRPEGALSRVSAACERDPESGAVSQVTALLDFEGGQNASFGAGFLTGTSVNAFTLVGFEGVITLDDFVMNWTNSFEYQDSSCPTGYTHRKGRMTPKDFIFVDTPSDTPQQVLMIENFAALARSGERERRRGFAEAAERTQAYLDAVWAAIVAR